MRVAHLLLLSESGFEAFRFRGLERVEIGEELEDKVEEGDIGAYDLAGAGVMQSSDSCCGLLLLIATVGPRVMGPDGCVIGENDCWVGILKNDCIGCISCSERVLTVGKPNRRFSVNGSSARTVVGPWIIGFEVEMCTGIELCWTR